MELGRLDECVESQIDARAATMRDTAGGGELIESQLRAFIPRIEFFGAQIHGVGAVRDRGAHRIERSGGREELGYSDLVFGGHTSM